MLKRLYVHNYKCLVNFEINFDKDISLFLGANGSGKSTVFEVLAKLRRVIVGEEKVENVFEFADSPRWLKHSDNNVFFELEIEIAGKPWKYSLTITIDHLTSIFIKEESLSLNQTMFIDSRDGGTLLTDNPVKIPFDDSRSSVYRGYADTFLENLRSLFIVRINPYEMAATIGKSQAYVKTDFSNFAEWFAHINEKNRRGMSTFEQAMRDILSGFDYFKIDQAGQVKVLMVDFENPTNKKEPISYYFNELSEGQKVLIALYALIYCAPDNSLICIDEPENFLALPEIQPWFDSLYDQCNEKDLQAILISHHPKIINFLANDSGYWFSRENNLTRIQKISAENESGLSIAELIERGWIDEP